MGAVVAETRNPGSANAPPGWMSVAEAVGEARRLLAAGNSGRAERLCRKILAAVPAQPDALHMLALMAHGRGQLDLAISLLRSACNRDPASPGHLRDFAEMCRQRGRFQEGEAAARRAVAGDETMGGAWNNLGIILQEVGKLAESRTSLERALALQPDNCEIHNNLANTYKRLGLDDLAEQHWRRALALNPHYPAAMSNLTILLIEQGKVERAREFARQALELNPRLADSWFNTIELTKFTPDDPGLATMEELLQADGVKLARDRMLVHFSLGKAYLDSDDADRAFPHFAQGNRLKRATLNYDSAGTRNWLASIGDSFNPEVMKKLAAGGAASTVPIFVLGMPRSGTTLIEQILASHPDIRGAGELSFLKTVSARLGGYPGFLATATPEQITELGDAYLSLIEPLADGTRHVVDKMPANFLYVGLIHLMLPQARIIHCRRDPVDTCLSCYTKLFAAEQAFTYDLVELGQFHNAYSALMDHWRKVLPASAFLEVDYEAVVENTEQQVRRMLEFLDLPWDDACRRPHETRRLVRTASAAQVRKPIYQTSKGRCRKYATHLESLLKALGEDTKTSAQT